MYVILCKIRSQDWRNVSSPLAALSDLGVSLVVLNRGKDLFSQAKPQVLTENRGVFSKDHGPMQSAFPRKLSVIDVFVQRFFLITKIISILNQRNSEGKKKSD